MTKDTNVSGPQDTSGVPPQLNPQDLMREFAQFELNIRRDLEKEVAVSKRVLAEVEAELKTPPEAVQGRFSRVYGMRMSYKRMYQKWESLLASLNEATSFADLYDIWSLYFDEDSLDRQKFRSYLTENRHG